MKRLIAVCAAFALVSLPAVAADKKIERVWKSKCSSCHGADGKAATEKGKKMKTLDMTTADFQKKSDADLLKAINEGVATEKDGVKKEMDGYKDLTDEQKTGLVAFMREFKK